MGYQGELLRKSFQILVTDTLVPVQLFHLPAIAYVREVVFIDPSGTSATSMSVNLNLAQYMCVGFNLLQLIR